MEKKEFTYPSADGKTAIHAVEWLPEGAPRGVVQISHGVSEYILRYEPFAAFLTGRGFAVTGNDHLGHGGSVPPGGTWRYFGGPGSWDMVVEDIYTLRNREKANFRGLPYFLLGHSMGSFLARTYLIRYPDTVDGAIIMGTGQMPPALVAGGRLVAAAEIRRLGERAFSPMVSRLSFEAYNKIFRPNRTEKDWLSVDEGNVDAFIADPLCGGDATLGLFREMLDGIRLITKQSNVEKMNLNTPVFFVSGDMDPVGDCGKGVRRAYGSFQKAGVRDVTMKLYPGMRHEILNDVCRETVYRDLLAWMEARMPPAAGAGTAG